MVTALVPIDMWVPQGHSVLTTSELRTFEFCPPSKGVVISLLDLGKDLSEENPGKSGEPAQGSCL